MANQTVKKTIIFYELVPTLKNEEQTHQENFLKIFRKIRQNITNKDESSFVKHGSDEYLIDVCLINDDTNQVIKGIIRSFSEESPLLFNKKNYDTKEIQKAVEEEIVFSTHFVIRTIGNKNYLAIEVNRKGPNYQNLIYYLEIFGKRLNSIDAIVSIPIVRDSLEEIKEKFGKCSEFLVKIERSNIPKLKEIDSNLHGIMDNIKDSYEQDYVTMILKYDYKDRTDTNKIWITIKKIRDFLIKNEDSKDTFEKLEIRGEEKTKNLKLELFDLLSDKLKVNVAAEKRINSEAIVYLDFLTNISIALNETIPIDA